MRRVIHTARCDWCGEDFPEDFTDEDELDLIDAMQREGWFSVRHDDEAYDFCSLDCLTTKLS